MKFKVDNANESVNMMRFKLSSTNMQFRHTTAPRASFPDYSSDVNLNEVEIIFNDSYELDSLIEALLEFRNGSHNQMGEWKRKCYR